jgi:hypothetical protein
MTSIDPKQLAGVVGGFASLQPPLAPGRTGMRRPPQLPPVIRGAAGGIPLVIPRSDGGPPNVIVGPKVGPLI